MADFDIHFENQTATLTGHLVDSTCLESYKECISNSHHFDFSKLYSVSWLGLQKLFTIIASTPRTEPAQLIGISAQIYRIVKVFPEAGLTFQPLGFGVETVNSDGQRSSRMTTMDQLVKLSLDQGAFVKFPDGSRVLGSLTHLCRPHFRSHLIPSPRNLAAWADQNITEALFWHDYICFTRIILDTSAVALRATTLLIENSLQHVLMCMMDASQAWKAVNPEFKDPSARSLMQLLPAIQEMSQGAYSRMVDKCTAYAGLATKWEDAMLGASEASPHALVNEICTAGEALTTAAQDLDNIGFELGQKVFSFPDPSGMLGQFEGLEPSTVSDKMIATIRRKLKFPQMDVATWGQTIEEMRTCMRSSQTALEGCVIALQAFDLIKQVIEHRIRESTLLRQDLPSFLSGNLPWQSVRDHILDAAQDKLVTDQEKHSFSFFFPDKNNRDDQKMSAGDVAFF